LPAFKYRWVGDGGGREGERLDFGCPSGAKEGWDGKSIRHRQRWQDMVEWGDVETRSETMEDVAHCQTFRLVIKPVKLREVKAYLSLKTRLQSWVHLPIHAGGKDLKTGSILRKDGKKSETRNALRCHSFRHLLLLNIEEAKELNRFGL
jgi:hypothetical protein